MPLSPQNNWVLVNSSVLHADFTTHSNYLNCLKTLSQSLSMSVNLPNIQNPNRLSPIVQKKKILVDLTKNNLDSELQQINNFKDYSQICVSWIPVKSYYLFFNLLILLEYLITDEEKWLLIDHGDAHKEFKDLIRTNCISFNINSFNTIYIPSRILSWSIPSGNNVRTSNRNYNILERQVIKKMFMYSMEEYKRVRGIKSLRGTNKANFLNSTTINLCEFFYWYRIKANYRDMEFVNSAVGINDFYTFYSDYYVLTNNFYNTMKAQINAISCSRYGRNIL